MGCRRSHMRRYVRFRPLLFAGFIVGQAVVGC
jgi:uncharacterized Fe-S cluster-containing radical SAM superfamily protein